MKQEGYTEFSRFVEDAIREKIDSHYLTEAAEEKLDQESRKARFAADVRAMIRDDPELLKELKEALEKA